MGLKRSIVLIGSVLVLAACDNVSAPTGPMSLNQSAASAKKADTTRTTTTRTTSALDGGDPSGCIFVRSGADSTLFCPQIQ